MMAMQLSAAAQVLDCRRVGDDVRFCGVSTDTRTLAAGNLFVALHGPHFDGHDYIGQAQQCGAAAAAVSRPVEADLPQLQVEDTRLALGALAAHWRSRFELPLVAVTGSNGKTTVKEMLAAILRRCGNTLVTRGNYNNDIGVPHTLFRLDRQHDYAVLELGANHPGEIAYLTGLAQPVVALINNAGPAHLEGFGSLDGVARAKGELFDCAGAGATCVINADDAYAGLWRTLAAPRVQITFGLEQAADVSARWQGDLHATQLRLQTPQGGIDTRIGLPGRHNVMNALAATAAALAAGAGLEEVAAGLADVQPVKGRWQPQPGIAGSQVIDDTYNANPASLLAGLQLLAGAGSEVWLVLGDMGELGEQGGRLHRDMGRAAKQAGVGRLLALGPLAGLAAAEFGEGGRAFDAAGDMVDTLRAELRAGVTVLVKGSRSMHMERVAQALVAAAEAAGGRA